jgi:hypothetical protein
MYKYILYGIILQGALHQHGLVVNNDVIVQDEKGYIPVVRGNIFIGASYGDEVVEGVPNIISMGVYATIGPGFAVAPTGGDIKLWYVLVYITFAATIYITLFD